MIAVVAARAGKGNEHVITLVCLVQGIRGTFRGAIGRSEASYIERKLRLGAGAPNCLLKRISLIIFRDTKSQANFLINQNFYHTFYGVFIPAYGFQGMI